MNAAAVAAANPDTDGERYAAWFHELDGWTEYWDIYQPQTKGRYYFGDGGSEHGLLSVLLPREERPPAFDAWVRLAIEARDSTAPAAREGFARAVTERRVLFAVREVDALLARLFEKHFGDAGSARVQDDYLQAVFRFATDSLPSAAERLARVAGDDPRKTTAGRHALEGDLMWFAWALQIEAANIVAGRDAGHSRRALMLAAVATGCPANFAWRQHRRTRPEYRADEQTERLLRERGLAWAADFDGAADEIHALYRIREWGDE